MVTFLYDFKFGFDSMNFKTAVIFNKNLHSKKLYHSNLLGIRFLNKL